MSEIRLARCMIVRRIYAILSISILANAGFESGRWNIVGYASPPHALHPGAAAVAAGTSLWLIGGYDDVGLSRETWILSNTSSLLDGSMPKRDFVRGPPLLCGVAAAGWKTSDFSTRVDLVSPSFAAYHPGTRRIYVVANSQVMFVDTSPVTEFRRCLHTNDAGKVAIVALPPTQEGVARLILLNWSWGCALVTDTASHFESDGCQMEYLHGCTDVLLNQVPLFKNEGIPSVAYGSGRLCLRLTNGNPSCFDPLAQTQTQLIRKTFVAVLPANPSIGVAAEVFSHFSASADITVFGEAACPPVDGYTLPALFVSVPGGIISLTNNSIRLCYLADDTRPAFPRAPALTPGHESVTVHVQTPRVVALRMHEIETAPHLGGTAVLVEHERETVTLSWPKNATVGRRFAVEATLPRCPSADSADNFGVFGNCSQRSAIECTFHGCCWVFLNNSTTGSNKEKGVCRNPLPLQRQSSWVFAPVDPFVVVRRPPPPTAAPRTPVPVTSVPEPTLSPHTRPPDPDPSDDHREKVPHVVFAVVGVAFALCVAVALVMYLIRGACRNREGPTSALEAPINDTDEVRRAHEALVTEPLITRKESDLDSRTSRRPRPEDAEHTSPCSKDADDEESRAEDCLPAVLIELSNRRYTIQSVVGRGGFGAVYHAIRDDGEHEALKYIPYVTVSDAKAALEEARALMLLQGHPHVMPVRAVIAAGGDAMIADASAGVASPSSAGKDEATKSAKKAAETAAKQQRKDRLSQAPAGADGLFDEDGCIILASPFFARGDLRRFVNRTTQRHGVFPEPLAAHIGAQVCSAVFHAHENNVAHRDLKPENVLLCDDEQTVVISDFGLSKVMNGRSETLKTKAGSLPFVAPECFRGRYHVEVDHWSLGCLLYAVATGRVDAETTRMMFADARRPAFEEEIMRDLRGVGYGDDYCGVVLGLLQFEPSRRAPLPIVEAKLRRIAEAGGYTETDLNVSPVAEAA